MIDFFRHFGIIFELFSYFPFRKMILDYFNEETTTLVARSDCCDNCAKGVSTWREQDLYAGFLENGTYDFTSDGRLLFNAIREMEAKRIETKRKSIVELLMGQSMRYTHLKNSFGKGRLRRFYYWDALIDLLMSKEYIGLVAGKTHLTLSDKAHQFLSQPLKPLHVKPAGAMYRFLEPKMNTPISDHVWD